MVPIPLTPQYSPLAYFCPNLRCFYIKICILHREREKIMHSQQVKKVPVGKEMGHEIRK